MNDPLIGIRHMTERDRGYVIRSWLSNYKRDGLGMSGIEDSIFYNSYRTIVGRLLKQHTTVVAYDPKDVQIVLGFLCGDLYASAAVVHYAYVPKRLRGNGVGRLLLEQLGWTSNIPIMKTHRTFASRSLQNKFAILYNPYMRYADFAGALKNGKQTHGYSIDDRPDPDNVAGPGEPEGPEIDIQLEGEDSQP